MSPAVSFSSILFERSSDRGEREDPSMFSDLNLDQVFAAVAAGRDEYDLIPFFGAPLRDVRAVEYRHQVQQDLEDMALSRAVADFALRMREMRKSLTLSGKLRTRYQKEYWFLDAASIYCRAVSALADALAAINPGSRGFTAKPACSCPDQVFTHFEQEEDLATLRGKFEDELVRIRGVLDQATGDSVLVMNESFASTTLRDALFVGERVLDRMTALGLLGVYVTFVDELASRNEACVSMVATVIPDNPAERTYELVRKPADGLAYAAAIAGKYGLTYRQLTERLAS